MAGGHSRLSLIFTIVSMILVVVLIPLVHPSRARLQDAAKVAEHTTAKVITQDHENYVVKRMGKEATSASVTQGSERQVPSGADPIHHNNRPTTKP